MERKTTKDDSLLPIIKEIIMRNPTRIKRILSQIETIWENNPDLRFGQLVYYLFDTYAPAGDIFFAEDDRFEEHLKTVK